VILAAVATAGCLRDAAPGPVAASADNGAPPADKDAPPPRAGFVWMPGHWARSGDRWVWLEGYFEPARPHYRWEPGRWVTVRQEGKRDPEVEWATSVRDVSSEYSDNGWSARQALGPPDVFPAEGDVPQAWASLTPDAAVEFIEVGYERPMRASGVDIYETFNPGAVTLVQLFSAQQEVVSVATSPTSDQPLRARLACTEEPIVAVKLTLDSAAVPGWNEIDAIGLVPCD
jgi:hypothetical protein